MSYHRQVGAVSDGGVGDRSAGPVRRDHSAQGRLELRRHDGVRPAAAGLPAADGPRPARPGLGGDGRCWPPPASAVGSCSRPDGCRPRCPTCCSGSSWSLCWSTRGFRLAQPAQRYLASLFVVLGVAFLISRGYHGQLIFAGFSRQGGGFLEPLRLRRELPVRQPRRSAGTSSPRRSRRLARLRLPVRLQGAADHHLLRRLHERSLLPRHHAAGDRGDGPLHALDHRHQRRRDPVVHAPTSSSVRPRHRC